MKLLFVSCLFLLAVLCESQAQEEVSEPKDLEAIISRTQIPHKKELLNQLLVQAKNSNICPRLLFSLGISKWETLSPQRYPAVIQELAQLVPFLKDSSGLDLTSSLK